MKNAVSDIPKSMCCNTQKSVLDSLTEFINMSWQPVKSVRSEACTEASEHHFEYFYEFINQKCNLLIKLIMLVYFINSFKTKVGLANIYVFLKKIRVPKNCKSVIVIQCM